MNGSGGYHPVWGNPITNELTWYALTDKWMLAQKLRLPKIQFAKHMKLKKKEDQSVVTSILLRMGEQNTHGRSYRDKVWKVTAEMEGKTIQRLPHLGLHPINKTQTLLHMCSKILLTGLWYSFLLWGYASAWQTQKWMLTVSHWMEHRALNGLARESTQGAKGVYNIIGGTTMN